MTQGIPSTWADARLEEIAEIHDHLREPVNSTERASRQGPYPYYGATGQVGWIDGYRQDGEYVLLGEDGAPFLDPSKSKAYMVSGKCWVNNHAHVLKGVEGICTNKYLLHALNVVNYRGYANGTTRLKLTQEAMRRLPVRIAPAKEQHRIVEKIDELLSDLDAGVVALERARSNLKRYRAAVLKAAVEGKLTEQWRKAHPDVEPASKLLERILAERRRKWEEAQLAKFAAAGKASPKGWKDKYPEPVKPKINELPNLPAGWVWSTLDSLTEIVGGLTVGQKRKPGEKTRAVPYLRVANVQRGYLDLSEIKTIEASEADIRELALQPGDILFNEGGDRDKLGRGWVWAGEVEECVHQNHVFRARPVSTEIQSKFISFHGNTFGKMWFQTHGKQSVNLASINMTVLRQFPVPLPPMMEQIELVKEIEDRLSVNDKATAEIETGLLRAASLRQSILKRAFEGKLVPQDPNDEPACVLLERIRNTRAGESPQRAPKRRTSPA